jgi:ribosomal protein S18 acetylase RimI-like enzyme
MVTNIGHHKWNDAMAENNIQGRILTNLKASPDGLQTDELAALLSLTRHTVSKYLEILRAEGKIHFRKIGRSRLWREISTTINVRMLSIDDLDAILTIEERIKEAGNLDDPDRMEYLKETAMFHLESGDPLMNLGAELEGKLVGFVLAETRLGEFGGAERTGWIKVLGVDPDYQGRGIGHKLGETLMGHFQRKNVKRVRTLVAWYDGNLISYFKSLGFDLLNMIPLEKELDSSGSTRNEDFPGEGENT